MLYHHQPSDFPLYHTKQVNFLNFLSPNSASGTPVHIQLTSLTMSTQQAIYLLLPLKKGLFPQYASSLSIATIKHWPKATWGEMGWFSLHNPITVHHWEKSGKEAGAKKWGRPWRNHVYGLTLYLTSHPAACLPFLTQPTTICLAPRVGRLDPPTSIPTHLPTGQSDEGIFSLEIPSSRLLACIKLTNSQTLNDRN